MASFNTISIRFNADLKQFRTQIENASKSMQKYGQQMQEVGQGLTLGVTLPLLGLGAAAVKAASDAEETASKFNVVFDDISQAANRAAKELSTSYGLSSQASKQLLSDTGDLLTGFGFSQEAALKYSTEVNKLAVDLASFTNYSGGAKGASEALTKALLGEREQIKSLGIAILESDVKARVLINTQQGLTFETERQAKAFATLQLAQEQSKNAIGDYARTSDSFANKMRVLKGRLNDVAVQFGEILLPYVTQLADSIQKLVNKFAELSPATKELIVVFSALAAVIGPLLITLGFMMTTVIPGLIKAYTYLSATTIPAVIASFKSLNASMALTAGLVAGVVAAIAAIGYAFTAFVQQITPAVSKLETFWNLIKTGPLNTLGFITSQLNSNTEALVKNANAAEESVKKITGLQGIFAKYAPPEIESPKFTPDDGSGPTPQVSSVMPPGFIEDMRPIQTSPFDIIAPKMQEQVETMSLAFAQMRNNANIFNERLSGIVQSTATNFAAGFGRIIGAMASGKAGMAAFGKLIVGTIADMAIQIGKMAIGIGFAVEGIKKALQSLAGPVAIAAGIALVALGSFAKSALASMASGGSSSNIPALADGGLVYGPTLGLIGEYSGARANPEVIAPLNKLKNMISDVVGGDGYIAETRLRGSDLMVSLKRTQASQNRRG